jgi:hypothetical protein|tara:strand:+ start:412 stop:624 length:213 start_codon:yes stop_codon:yes gene_type:complete
MSALTFEQKNTNILNRFESESKGTKLKAYDVKVDGKMMTMIFMDGSNIEQATKSAKNKFPDRVEGVYAKK